MFVVGCWLLDAVRCLLMLFVLLVSCWLFVVVVRVVFCVCRVVFAVCGSVCGAWCWLLVVCCELFVIRGFVVVRCFLCSV